jgi:hypoxanthine phosphoribosyltransferase
MNESLNAATTLLPLLSLDSKNGFYVNSSILGFSAIATINHIMPENLEGLTHGVKMMYSNLLFSFLGLNPYIGFMISLIDLLPMITKDKKIMNIGEKIVQIPRKLIEIYFMYNIYMSQKSEFYFIIVSKIIYFFERRERIKRGSRNDFPAIHSGEHIGLYLLVKELTNTEFNLLVYIFMLLFFVIFLAVLIISMNYYIAYYLNARAPDWVKENPALMNILNEKVQSNKNSFKIHNYIAKPWLGHLKLQFIHWEKMEEIIQEMSKKLKVDEIDMIVGISTGGAFVGAYLAKVINKPFDNIHSKLWSGMNFPQNVAKVSMWMLGRDVSPQISGCPNVKGKRVLLVDDTTYTGITLKKNTKCLISNGAESVKTLVLYTYKTNGADYIHETDYRVPIIWEWGVEID